MSFILSVNNMLDQVDPTEETVFWPALIFQTVFWLIILSIGFFLIEKANQRLGQEVLSKRTFALALTILMVLLGILQFIQNILLPTLDECNNGTSNTRVWSCRSSYHSPYQSFLACPIFHGHSELLKKNRYLIFPVTCLPSLSS